MPASLSSKDDNPNRSLRLPKPRLAERAFSSADFTITALTDDALFEACGTRIAFTQRSGGASAAPFDSLNLSTSVGDELDVVSSNRTALCSVFGTEVETQCLITPNQVHGIEIVEVGNVPETQARALEGADGIVCAKPDVPVLLCFADCVPVILVAPGGSFAVLHSGWRGAIDAISAAGARKLCAASGCYASELNCYIGPHIGACCYEVSDELVERFVDRFGAACDAGCRHLDLTAAVKVALLEAGADESRIAVAEDCTSCRHDLYYSYRAENGRTGRHGAFAIRKEES